MAEKVNLIYVVEDYQHGLELKDKQHTILTHIQEHKGDLLVCLPVGYDKSIIYHLLPSLLRCDTFRLSTIIVISLLNIIQKDQMESLLEHGIKACRLNIRTTIEDTTDPGGV
jgi:superfamily II DNA helicase RecQ